MPIFLFWIVFSLLVGAYAGSKKINVNTANSFVEGVLWSFFLSPVVGLVIVMLRKPDVKSIEKNLLNDKESKKCPQCAELIKFEALKCRFCGHEFKEEDLVEKVEKNKILKKVNRATVTILVGVGIFFVLIILITLLRILL